MARQSDRKWDRRLGILKTAYDFNGVRCLDLGCNRGSFTFGVAGLTESVLGIDADESFIEGDVAYAAEQGVDNVEFRNETVTPELVDQLDHYDVTLMLSLLHHILTASAKYARFKTEGNVEDCVQLLARVADHTDTLIFEMGQTDEDLPWAADLPAMTPNPATWITERLLKPAGFNKIHALPPTAYTGWLGIPRRLASRFVTSPSSRQRFTGKRLARTALRFDPRDVRPIFIATK